jgi:hypothetical protein
MNADGETSKGGNMPTSKPVTKAQKPLTKVEVAKRQLECAVRLHYRGEDPVPIHTIVAAGFRIVRDLAEQSGETSFWRRFKATFRPRMEKVFWREHVATANFLKHADNDPDATLSPITAERNEMDLLFACILYPDVAKQLSIEMAIHCWIVNAANPSWFEGSKPNEVLDQIMKQLKQLKSFNVDTLAGRLELGRE